MTLPAGASRRNPRRSQAERSAESRERLLAAAVRLLREGGYSAANVKAIAQEAGMSLGSLQHHFPSKAKLMTAVIERLAEKRIAAYHTDAEAIDDPVARYSGLFETTWNLVKEPEFVAALEILLARRSDGELWAESESVIHSIDTTLEEWVSQIARAAGETPSVARFRRNMSNTFIYGLATQMAMGMDAALADDLAAFWKQLVEMADKYPNTLRVPDNT